MFARRPARHARRRPAPPAQAAALARLATVAPARASTPVVAAGGWVPRRPGAPTGSADRPRPAQSAASDAPAASGDGGDRGDPDDEDPEPVPTRATEPDGPAGERADGSDAADPLTVRVASRVGVAPRHVAVVAAALLVALAVGAVVFVRARPRDVPVPVRSTPPAALASPATSVGGAARPTTPVLVAPAPTPTPTVLVHVVGKVRHPGVVSLPVGARVQDALAAAGGVRRGVDLATLNLARPVVDGEQIAVGVRRRAPTGNAGTGSDTGTADTAVIDLNTATLEQLESLPSVGPVTAQRILDFRASNGPFTSVDELLEVSGIGEKTLADIAPHVRV